jgi:hypothetical protein
MTDDKAAATDDMLARRAYSALPVLNGYPEVFSVFAGEKVHVRVARKPGLSLRALFGAPVVAAIALRNVVTGAVSAAAVPAGAAVGREKPASYRDGGAGYTTRLEIATDGLEPGLYECTIRDSFGASSKNSIHFNVKPARNRDYDLVCVLPTFTWHAYNRLSGGSFYSESLGAVRTITTRRPLSVVGDNSIEAAIPFLAAFTQAGAKLACVDSRDLHLGLLPGGRVPVMALLTHDEYWSAPMREAVNSHVRRGGALIVAAGNVCWWKIDVDGDNLTVDKAQNHLLKRGPDGARAKGHQWHQQGDPEERTFISSFRFGGYAGERIPLKRDLPRFQGIDADQLDDPGSLKIVRADHPLFEGVTLDPGDRLGDEVPLVYREIDAVPLTPDGKVDRKWYDADKIEPVIIATGTVIRGSPFHIPVAEAGIVVEADVGRGHVLHMGSFGWSRGLVQKNERVKRVVQNAYRHCRAIAAERRRKLP